MMRGSVLGAVLVLISGIRNGVTENCCAGFSNPSSICVCDRESSQQCRKWEHSVLCSLEVRKSLVRGEVVIQRQNGVA